MGIALWARCKRVVDFLLVLIELFRYVLRLRRYTSDYRFKIGDFAPTTQNLGRMGRPQQPFFFS